MTSQDFFEQLRIQYDQGLPFVAYSKPGRSAVQVIFQEDASLNEISDYKEIGFIFASFSKEQKAILIPGTPKITYFEPEINGNHEIFVPKTDETDKNKYKKLVDKAIDAITTKALKKVVLSRKRTYPNIESPIMLFKQILSIYPDAFSYIWFHPEVGLWLGATPETLLAVSGLRFNTMALAGTQIDKGDKNPQWQTKELEEQQLVVDSIKGQLEKFDLRSVAFAARETVKAGNLLHLRTRIAGVLKSSDQLQSIIQALHPTPAVCGLPRDEATEFILKNEGYDRQFYTGYLGELNQKTEESRAKSNRNTENLAYKSIKIKSNLYVNLRCMQYFEDAVTIYAGGGITHDSEPDKEWEETVSKMQTMRQILGKK